VDAVNHGTEGIAALLKRVMAASGMSQSEIADRSGVPLATLNAWITGRRSPGKGPQMSAKLRKLAEVLPGVSVREVFEAAGRTIPGELKPDAQQRINELFVSLSAGRQRVALQVLEALAAEEPRATRP
jgi:transcriptional regulator with XRE-family HTH domain